LRVGESQLAAVDENLRLGGAPAFLREGARLIATDIHPQLLDRLEVRWATGVRYNAINPGTAR